MFKGYNEMQDGKRCNEMSVLNNLMRGMKEMMSCHIELKKVMRCAF